MNAEMGRNPEGHDNGRRQERQTPQQGERRIDDVQRFFSKDVGGQDEIPFADADWKQVPFGSLRDGSLEPFQVITDIPNISGYKDVEEQVCRSLLLPFIPSEKLDLSREGIMSDRIINHLRPKNFNGSLINGRAIILPFDAERAVEYTGLLKKRLASGKLTDDTPGFRVIYSGELTSSRAGTIGTMFQEASYFLDHPLTSASTYKRIGNDYLRRTLNPNIQTNEVAEVMAQELESSQQKAEEVSKFALRHLYGGGSPGLGKRR